MPYFGTQKHFSGFKRKNKIDTIFEKLGRFSFYLLNVLSRMLVEFRKNVTTGQLSQMQLWPKQRWVQIPEKREKNWQLEKCESLKAWKPFCQFSKCGLNNWLKNEVWNSARTKELLFLFVQQNFCRFECIFAFAWSFREKRERLPFSLQFLKDLNLTKMNKQTLLQFEKKINVKINFTPTWSQICTNSRL